MIPSLMPAVSEHLQRGKENAVNFAQSHLIDFLLWLLIVELTIETDETAQTQLNTYLANGPTEPIVFSAVPHTGHPDSLYVYKAIEQLSPATLNNLQFVSAKDTWQSRFSRLIARAVAGEPYLFDRQNLTVGSMRTQLEEMGQLLRPEEGTPRSLAIYPQGTRTLGAPVEDLPVSLARHNNVPLAVLNISGAEQVMPKVPEGQQASQVIQLLIRRLRMRRANIKNHTHHVHIKLADFIPPELSRKEMKERFFASHDRTENKKSS